jgi:peptide chain release factor
LNTIWLSISAGSGPEECSHCASLTLQALLKEAEAQGITAEVIESEPARHKGDFRSCLVSIEGSGAEVFADSWTGAVQWIWHSAYRPHHKRKNWFIQVKPYYEPEQGGTFNLADVRFETMRAGGPGGQYVNKTESAVRAIHVPTGKTVVVRNERSQLLNKRLAIAQLASMLADEQAGKEAESRAGLRHIHWELVRGNPIRVFNGETMKQIEVKSKGVKANGC